MLVRSILAAGGGDDGAGRRACDRNPGEAGR
jgi:hypothetical protein